MTAATLLIAVLGFSPAAMTPLSALSFLSFAGHGKEVAELQQKLDTPALRAWAARNGEAAIRLQPGISTEN